MLVCQDKYHTAPVFTTLRKTVLAEVLYLATVGVAGFRYPEIFEF